MARKKDFYKLAQLIKLAARDVSEEGHYWKIECVSNMLNLKETGTDNEPDVLDVKDDSGYRSILIGDDRGNVSLDTGKIDNTIFHRGYALLYSEQCSYEGDTRKWKYICFPHTKEIATMLEKLYNAEYCPQMIDYFVGDDNDISSCVTYLSEVVKKYINAIASDERTAHEIFSHTM